MIHSGMIRPYPLGFSAGLKVSSWRLGVKFGELLTGHPLMLFLQVLDDLLHRFIGVKPELRNIRACPMHNQHFL